MRPADPAPRAAVHPLVAAIAAETTDERRAEVAMRWAADWLDDHKLDGACTCPCCFLDEADLISGHNPFPVARKADEIDPPEATP